MRVCLQVNDVLYKVDGRDITALDLEEVAMPVDNLGFGFSECSHMSVKLTEDRELAEEEEHVREERVEEEEQGRALPTTAIARQ